MYNAFQQGEDISVVQGCHEIKFERSETESSSEDSYGEEDDNTICALSTQYNKLRLTVNERHCSKFEFYDKRCGDPVVTIDKDGIDMHCNRIRDLDDPNCSKDAANK